MSIQAPKEHTVESILQFWDTLEFLKDNLKLTLQCSDYISKHKERSVFSMIRKIDLLLFKQDPKIRIEMSEKFHV